MQVLGRLRECPVCWWCRDRDGFTFDPVCLEMLKGRQIYVAGWGRSSCGAAWVVRCWHWWFPTVAHVLNDGSVGLGCEALKESGWGQWRLLMWCRRLL